jgi:hypothetical protein
MLLPAQWRAVLRDYVVGRIISKEDIEIMEDPACGTKNQDFFMVTHQGRLGFGCVSSRWYTLTAVPPITIESDFVVAPVAIKEGPLQETLCS